MTTLHVDHEAPRARRGRLPGGARARGDHRLPPRPANPRGRARARGGRGRRRRPGARGGRRHDPPACPSRRRLPTVEVDGAFGVRATCATPPRSPPPRLRAPRPPPSAGASRRSARTASCGQVAQLRDGPELIFGDAARAARQVGGRLAGARRPRGERGELRGRADPGTAGRGGLPAETIVPVAPAGATSTVPPGTPTDATLGRPSTRRRRRSRRSTAQSRPRPARSRPRMARSRRHHRSGARHGHPDRHDPSDADHESGARHPRAGAGRAGHRRHRSRGRGGAVALNCGQFERPRHTLNLWSRLHQPSTSH